MSEAGEDNTEEDNTEEQGRRWITPPLEEDLEGQTPEEREQAGRERRRFSRVPFLDLAKLMQGDHLWLVDVFDISLKGALVSRPAAWGFDGDLPCTLQLILGRDDAVVTMRARQAYTFGHRLGLRCDEIDIDSVALLTGIIEANTGDPSLARRELRELASLHDAPPLPQNG